MLNTELILKAVVLDPDEDAAVLFLLVTSAFCSNGLFSQFFELVQNKFYQLNVTKPLSPQKLILYSTLKSYTPTEKLNRNGLACSILKKESLKKWKTYHSGVKMKFVSFPVTRSFLCILFKVKIFCTALLIFS